jgi:OmpA-OmpF porin, OOP family
MQAKRIVTAICGMSAFLTVLPAFAVMSAPEGWYLEANAGSTYLSNDDYPGSKSETGIGANANVGYKFLPYVTAELGYTRYSNTNIKDGAGTKAATVRTYSYDIAAKGMVPISDSGFEPFAKVGIQRLNSSLSIDNQTAANNLGISKTTNRKTGPYWALGGQMYFTPEFAVVAQWAQAVGSNSTGTLSLLSLGISFIFY